VRYGRHAFWGRNAVRAFPSVKYSPNPNQVCAHVEVCTALGLQGLAFWRAGESGQGIGANSSTWYGLACSAHLRASEARHSCCSRNAPIWGARAWMVELLKSERQCSRRACMIELSHAARADLSTKGPRNMAKRTELCLFRACGPAQQTPHHTDSSASRKCSRVVCYLQPAGRATSNTATRAEVSSE
jgi:hypothetical protein